MPPKSKAKLPVKTSNSKSLIPTGPKDVQVSSRSKRKDGPVLPSTARAMILRSAAMGTGEISHASKTLLVPRAKLDLIAEDLIEQAKTAVAAPFRIKEATSIAESLMADALDDITDLQDPDLFYAIIEQEIQARAPQTEKDKDTIDAARNPSFVAKLVGDRIHNAYLLASGWRFVCDALLGLEAEGMRDDNVVNMLKSNDEIRGLYMAMFKVVSDLTSLAQNKFSVLATTTPHYQKYFKKVEGDLDEPDQVIFDWNELKKAGRSFLDCIIIELAFPRAPYPNGVLYQILKDACDEAPREAKRFPQSLWDSIGDFSNAVSIQQIVEIPLIGPEGATLKSLPFEMPAEYTKWIDAHVYSAHASDQWANYKDIIFPLSRTKNATTLQNMWKYVNLNYKQYAQQDIDALWGLEAKLLRPTPQWHSVRIRINMDPDAGDFKGTKKKAILAITNGDDTDEGMPDLQDVSDSSDDDFDAHDDTDEEGFVEPDGDLDDESGYDTDQEDEMREMIKEAMNAAVEDDWVNDPTSENQFTQDDSKGNPFLKLLGSLRGRMFTSNSKLKTGGSKIDPSKLPKPSKPKKKPAAATASGKTTVESEDDEEDTGAAAKKKKKKPKKKKKKTGAATGAAEEEPILEQVSPPPPEVAAPQAPASPVVTPAKPPAKSPAKPKAAPSVVPPAFGMSTTSLVPETVAQSARSYIQAEQLDQNKNKVKSRPGHSSLFSTVKGGILSRFGVKTGEKPEVEAKNNRRNWFSHLNRRARANMHQLLNTSEDASRGSTGMKWDVFAQLMKDMGFEMDMSTAGSSVRFDPPDGRDRSISFHKPHPNPDIDRITLKKWSKKLQKYYGWKPEDVMV